MTDVIALSDYQGRFESKNNSGVYRAGMDCKRLEYHFQRLGYSIEFMNYCQVDMRSIKHDQVYIYTSSEDPNYRYKSYIEDVIYALELHGVTVLPPYKFIRANNNKVFMEMLRDSLDDDEALSIVSHAFGTYEDLVKHIECVGKPPYVIKSSGSAASIGVRGANSKNELLQQAKELSRSIDLFDEAWDIGRYFRHKGYRRESLYRNKFIVQNQIEGLSNDWKVIAYGEKYYILARYNRENDFRASGSGNYSANDQVPIPQKILSYAKRIHHQLGTPNVSLDIAYHEGLHYLIEFQGLYFGSTTHALSDYYWKEIDGKWQKIHESLELEQIYAESICKHLETHGNRNSF